MSSPTVRPDASNNLDESNNSPTVLHTSERQIDDPPAILVVDSPSVESTKSKNHRRTKKGSEEGHSGEKEGEGNSSEESRSRHPHRKSGRKPSSLEGSSDSSENVTPRRSITPRRPELAADKLSTSLRLPTVGEESATEQNNED